MFKIKPDPSIRGQILSYFRGQFLPSPLKCRQPHTRCTHLPCPSPEMLLSRDSSQHPGDPVAIHSPTVTVVLWASWYSVYPQPQLKAWLSQWLSEEWTIQSPPNREQHHFRGRKRGRGSN